MHVFSCALSTSYVHGRCMLTSMHLIFEALKMNFTPLIILEILKLKNILQFDWPRVFLLTTEKPDFSQTSSFHRNPKPTIVHHLKPKKTMHSWNNFVFQNLYCLFVISGHFGHAWLNPTKITWSNCSFHECPTSHMQKFNTVTQPFPEILDICYFRGLWVHPGIPGHTR